MGHCIISGNSERTSVVGLLKITNQFYIGDLVECLYLSGIGLYVEGVNLSLSPFNSHLISLSLDITVFAVPLFGCLSMSAAHVCQD